MPRRLARRSAPAAAAEPPEPPEPPEPEEAHEEVTAEGWHPTPLLYDVSDACFILGKISKQMLYRLINQQQITPVKVGTRSMFTMEELERFVKAREAESAA